MIITPTSVTAHGGVGEVGGNKFLLETASSSVFLDFGQSFGEEKKFFDLPLLRPRNERVLRTLNILPEMEGCFYKDATTRAPSKVDALLISHAHLDHYGYSRYVSNDIPLVTGPATERIIVAREETSGGYKKEYKIANCSKRNGHEVYKNFITARTGKKMDLGDLEIHPIHVDHSIPAAYGFLLATPEATIAYTGDLRKHGTVSRFTADFARKASEANPDLLLVDCTHLPESKISSEERVEKEARNLISKTKNLVMVGFGSGDLDRMRSFYNAARQSDRMLAVSTKQAAILEAVRPDPRLDIVDLSDPNVAIFLREKERPRQWEREIMERYPNCCVRGEDISREQDRYVLVASLFDMNESLTITPEPDSLYILSSADPFDEEGEISKSKLMAWLDVLGMPCVEIHASGHMSGPEIREFVEEVNPRITVPIHTEKPELASTYLSHLDTDVRILEKGETLLVP